MIACPYCAKPLLETSPKCPHCQLDKQSLLKHMGPMPVIPSGVSDTTKLMSRREIKRLDKARRHFQRHFPQCHLNIVLRSFPQEVPLPSILFWLFNNAGLSVDAARRGKNRDILIVVDPKRQEAGLMLGYGLEPFVPQQALDHLLDRAAPLLEAKDHEQALSDLLVGLQDLLAGIANDISQNLGLPEPLVHESGPYDY